AVVGRSDVHLVPEEPSRYAVEGAVEVVDGQLHASQGVEAEAARALTDPEERTQLDRLADADLYAAVLVGAARVGCGRLGGVSARRRRDREQHHDADAHDGGSGSPSARAPRRHWGRAHGRYEPWWTSWYSSLIGARDTTNPPRKGSEIARISPRSSATMTT